jgi:DNA primase
VAGRIREQSIQEVREKARIDDVVGQYVTLRNAGGGSYKGLCPFHDEKSPSFNVNPSRGFYHCLAAETRVLTWEGPREIKDLAGGVHRILNRHGDWVDAPFKSYGVQRLYKITVSRNRQRKELFATDGHRWFVRAGRTRGSEREKQTLELHAGDRLVPTFPRSRIQRTTPSPFGIAHGFTYGDGTRSGSGSLAKLCPPKDLAMLKWFPNSHTTSDGENLLVHHLPAFFKALPPIDESVSYLYGWLAGYFAADGCVAEDGTIILNSAVRGNLEFVRTVCTRLGIATYGITSQVRLGLGKEPTDLYRVHLVNEDLTPDFFLIDEHRRRFESNAQQFARRGWVVQSVEETDRVEEVYCAEVEDGHAFTLEDNILTGNCFGCGEGGDVISFVMKIDGLSFGETVERLADKYGVTLQREEGDGPSPERRGPARGKLIEAHKVAAEFFAEQLLTPAALPGRQFLAERSFDQEAAQRFGVGFAPTDGKVVHQHLRGRGFTDEELVVGGLVRQSGWSVFQGRLIWPIRESSGDVIGFGARKLFDDDRIAGKYINTSETPIYKKNQVLYGIDLAREGMRKTGQAVVVEGYTDVMACHLSGVTTAVATCGTAFTPEHGKVVRRFMADFNASAGEVVFTFDGDAAGQAAAMKVFAGDEGFASQTYVAVAPDGLDPCDLRLKHGDDAVRELVAGRQPLYRFVLGNVVAKYDLDRADGRVDALREGARLVSSVRDRSKVDAFARELARMVGVDPRQALTEVRRSAGRRPTPQPTAPAAPQPAGPDPRDPRFALERETLKVLIQHPMAVGRLTAEMTTADFVHPAYQAVWALILAAGGPGAGTGDQGWAAKLAAAAPTPPVASVISALAVEPLPSRRTPDASYVTEHVVRLLEASLQRQIAAAHSRLQRADPTADPDGYRALFEELAGLEQQRRALRDRVLGG